METTVKVLCYKSKTLANGEHPLMVCVCKDRKRKYQSLGISIHPTHWDFKKNEPNELCPNRDEIRLLIQQRLYELQKTILNKRIEGKEFTASSLLHSQSSQSQLHNNVVECFNYYVGLLREQGRYRYAGMYDVSFSSFVKYAGSLDIPFNDIDVTWLKKYEAWMLRQGLAVNTIGTRVRHLRAVFNMAIEHHVMDKECYPFHAYKLSKVCQSTPKRALTKVDILKILEYKGKTEMERLAIALFTFSYFTAGINFIDMAMLKHENIVDGKLYYTRAKTKKQIIIPLQEKAMEIISNYYSVSTAKGSDYVFPIFSELHKTEVQKANRLHKVLAKINKALKHIGEELGLPIKLTTYVARHSFATVLKRAGVSTSIISESLGHSSEKITQTYLDSFENSQMNEALSHLK